MQRVNNQPTVNTWASTQHVDYDMSAVDEGSLQVVYADATTGAKTFSYLSGNSVTMTAHGQVTGSVGQCSTSGSLPTGLSTSTNYYIIVIDANTVQFATSLANAVAGTAVTLSGAGTGTQTFTPTSLATTGAVCKLQVSNDGTNFADVASRTVTITAAGNTYWEVADATTGRRLKPSWLRVLFTPTTGTVKLTVLPNFFKENK